MALEDNLIAAWRFEQSAGDSPDSSGNGNTAANVGGYTYAAAKVGNGITLDGATQYGSVAHQSLQDTNDVTVSVWVNPTDRLAYYAAVVASDGLIANYWLDLEQTTGKPRFTFTQGSGVYRTTVANTAVATGAWSLVTATYNSATGDAKIYINGALDKTASYSGNPDHAPGAIGVGAVIGASPTFTPTLFFKGSLDEAYVWGRVLSATEIGTGAGTLYNSGNGLTAWDNHSTTTQRYVSSTGSDSNPGTSGSPWLTIAKGQAWLNLSALPGDTLNFVGSLTGNCHAVAVQGTAGSRITITGGTVTCSNGSAVWLDECQYVTVDSVTSVGSGVSSGGVTTSLEAGILATLSLGVSLNGIVISNNTISGSFYGINVKVAASNANSFVSPSITGNTISACGFTGIFVSQFPHGASDSHVLRITSPTISGNTIYNIYGVNGAALTNQGDWASFPTVWSGFGIMLNQASGGVVSGNLIHDCGAASIGTDGGPTGILFVECDGTIAKLNEIYNQLAPDGNDGEGIDCDGGCRNCIVEYNYIHDCDGPALFDLNLGGAYTQNNNNTFRFNISQNNGRRTTAPGDSPLTECTFMAVSGTTNTAVYNNTDYSAKATGSQVRSILDASTSGATFRNNVLVISGSGTDFGNIAATSKIQGNRYHATGGSSFSLSVAGIAKTSLAQVQALGDGFEMVGAVAVGSVGDPQLKNLGGGGSYGLGLANSSLAAYDPIIGSAVIGAGLDLNGSFGVDPGTLDFHGRSNHPSSGYVIGASALAPVILFRLMLEGGFRGGMNVGFMEGLQRA